MANTVQFFCIKTLTNLHVGSGENNFGVVDNLVQRDVNTNLPTIHASSLKGALKEFIGANTSLTGKPLEKFMQWVFGNEKSAGKWQFLSADLLSRPLRSDKVPYLNATSPAVLGRLNRRLTDLGAAVPKGLMELATVKVPPDQPRIFDSELAGAIIEELGWQATEAGQAIDPALTKLLGDRLVLVNSADFQALDLPVIARNYLENGESKNLWYEEVVPYDSRFGWLLLADVADQAEGADQKNWDIFIQALAKPVQIGANASIGYGLCKLEHQP